MPQPPAASSCPFFLAICRDRPHDPDGFVWTVYFVNDSDEPVSVLETHSGAWTSCGDEIIKTSEITRRFEEIPPAGWVEVETDDVGSWDYVTWFRMRAETPGGEWQLKYSIDKGLRYPEVPIPLLGKPGVIRLADSAITPRCR